MRWVGRLFVACAGSDFAAGDPLGDHHDVASIDIHTTSNSADRRRIF